MKIKTKDNTELKNKEYIQLPLPSHKDVISNKYYPYNEVATMILNSKYNRYDEVSNYVYDYKLKEIIEEQQRLKNEGLYAGKIYSIRTLRESVKKIERLGFNHIEVVNTSIWGIAYKINPMANGGCYITIPHIMLKELLTSTNSNMLKLYIFLKSMLHNRKGFRQMDRKFICRKIGLSDKSSNNIDLVGNMLRSLANLGFIKINVDYVKDEKTTKTVYSYQLTTLEEYKLAKKRGIEVNSNRKIIV